MLQEHSHHHPHEGGSSKESMFQGSPKTMFIMGLLAGVAACSFLALFLLGWVIFGGKSLNLGGLLPSQQQQLAQQAPTPNDQQQPTAAAGPVKPVDEKIDHILGPKTAKVTLIEYSDFQCPFCGRHADTMKQVIAKYPKDVRVVFRHYPLSFHPFAQKMAEGSECAAELGGNAAFWKYHDLTFAQMNAGTFTSLEQVVTVGKEIGLDATKFKSCVDSGKYAGRVAQDEQEGAAAGVEGTPATFVNGKMVSGAVPLATLSAAIDAALK